MTSDSSSSSAGPLVLITGITGFLAQHVLRSVLAAPENYRVRGTVRSLAKSKSLIYEHLPSAHAARDKERVELVEVPDTASSDLSAALEGVEYVLHVASPYVIANITDPKEQLLKPAVDGTLNVLRYAKESKSIKRIGITSSFAAVTDFSKGGPNRPGFTYTAQDWQPFGEKEALEQGGAIAYSVSKKLAEKAAWDFVEENKGKIGWDLFTINPPMIYGPSTPWVTKKSLNTSSGAIYNLISSLPELPGDRLPLFCHASDVGDAHVLPLRKGAEAGSKRYLLCGGAFNWALGASHIAERYPELRERLPKGWEQAEHKGAEDYARLDCTDAEKLLGLTFKDWKTMLDDCIDDLLQLEKKPDWEK